MWLRRRLKEQKLSQDMAPGRAQSHTPCCKVHKNYSQLCLFCCIPLPLWMKIGGEITRMKIHREKDQEIIVKR